MYHYFVQCPNASLRNMVMIKGMGTRQECNVLNGYAEVICNEII